MKAALPPLDRAGQASVGIAVLAIGIVMTVVGVIFMIIAVVVIVRQRQEIRRYRCLALLGCLNLRSGRQLSQVGMPLPGAKGRDACMHIGPAERQALLCSCWLVTNPPNSI